jgi:hypothetical protein
MILKEKLIFMKFNYSNNSELYQSSGIGLKNIIVNRL